MATPASSRRVASFICQSCRQRLLPQTRRSFGTTSVLRADGPPSSDSALAGLGALSNNISQNSNRRKGFNNAASTTANPTSYTQILDQSAAEATSLLNEQYGRNNNAEGDRKPHRLHVYSTKHNTHLTLVQPPKSAALTASSGISGTSASAADQKKMVDVLLSISAGNIGFKKAGRGSYDAGYQLAAFLLKQIQEKGIQPQIQKLEIVLRGFGAGREAVSKALLGSEGRSIRGKISAVVDATRLKLGGPRSKKPRRLG